MRPQALSAALRRLKDLRQNFARTCSEDVPGLLAARTYARNYLDALSRAFKDPDLSPTGWSLVAVGGFGRGELSFASDLDLLFLHENRLSRTLHGLLREITTGLWDAGFEVGHNAASLSALKKLIHEDFSILTNYLEAQFIAGDRGLFDAWRQSYFNELGGRSRRRFLQDLLNYRTARQKQYGESSYLLEPHVKEGVGGLRDLHSIRWAGVYCLRSSDFSRLVEDDWLTQQEQLWLDQAYDFLWRVRLQLHQVTGRRQDQLLFSEQELLAGRLGFAAGEQAASVEAFMRLYYRHTARIRRTTTFFLERLDERFNRKVRFGLRRRHILPGPFSLEGRQLQFMEPDWVKRDPRLLMQIFWQAAQSMAHFHHQTGQVIRENLWAFDDAARRDPKVIGQFMDILLNPDHSFRVLKMMLETGFLETFIPELAPLRYRVQYDVYHLYTVDEHLLRTVRELHAMERGEDEALKPLGLREVFEALEHRRLLYVAAFLHDIGKGHGKGHAAIGARMIESIGPRLGLDPEETELLKFLVEQHLLLVETALKRDLMDEKPILRCSFEVGSSECLRLLYLLSIADSRATGPGAWSTWKASLLRELYVKVDHLLRRGDWKKEEVERRSAEVQEAVLARISEDEDRNRVIQWLDTLSFRYLLSQSADAILDHYAMEKDLAGRVLVVRTEPAEGDMWRITIATRDKPGLFATITGVLWVRGLNILAAEIFTRQSGIALDVITVERLPAPDRADEMFERIYGDLEQSIQDRRYLESMIAEKRKPSLFQKRTLPRREDRIVIDEEASDFYTIIEVYTWDRPGVLHAISQTLFELDITIQLAKISTPGAQVADVFYVTDLSGERIRDPDQHDRIRSRLLDCLTAVG